MISFLYLSLCDGGLRDVYGYVRAILCSNFPPNVLILFPTNEKKNLGAVFLFRFSKICCSYAGHTLSDLTLPPHWFHVLLQVSEPQRTTGAGGGGDDDDEGLSDDLVRMMGTATCDGVDDDDGGDWGACLDGGRLAYLCCAWQYSALSS